MLFIIELSGFRMCCDNCIEVVIVSLSLIRVILVIYISLGLLGV